MKSWSSHCGDSTKISEERLLLQINYKKSKTSSYFQDVLPLSSLQLANIIADRTDPSRVSINTTMNRYPMKRMIEEIEQKKIVANSIIIMMIMMISYLWSIFRLCKTTTYEHLIYLYYS